MSDLLKKLYKYLDGYSQTEFKILVGICCTVGAIAGLTFGIVFYG